MKHYILLFLLSIVTLTTAYGQSLRYYTMITYNSIYEAHPHEKFLYVSNTSSYYIEEYKREAIKGEPTITKTTDEEGNVHTKRVSGDIAKLEQDLVYYKDFNQNKLWFRDKNVISGKLDIVVEDLPPRINWQIEAETKTIANTYQCQKAIGEFRGRTYTAWFTTQIPISSGPWKLGGLPGLILEAHDEEKEVLFEFKSLQNVNEIITVDINKNDAIPWTVYKKQLQKELKAFKNEQNYLATKQMAADLGIDIRNINITAQFSINLREKSLADELDELSDN